MAKRMAFFTDVKLKARLLSRQRPKEAEYTIEKSWHQWQWTQKKFLTEAAARRTFFCSCLSFSAAFFSTHRLKKKGQHQKKRRWRLCDVSRGSKSKHKSCRKRRPKICTSSLSLRHKLRRASLRCKQCTIAAPGSPTDGCVGLFVKLRTFVSAEHHNYELRFEDAKLKRRKPKHAHQLCKM